MIEGSSDARWERLRCDWSELNVVRLTTIDSNVWKPKSNQVYGLASRADGGTDIDLVVVRRVWKRGAFLNEIVDPRRVVGVR